MKKLIYLLIITIQLISCSNTDSVSLSEDHNVTEDHKLSEDFSGDTTTNQIQEIFDEVNLYCWNFAEEKSGKMKVTDTFIRVEAKFVTKEENKIQSKTEFNREDVMKLDSLIYSGEVMDKLDNGLDSRLVLTIIYESGRTDTLIYMSKNKFCRNNEFIMEYKFNALNTMKTIFDIEHIDCFSE